jgi:small-conductance mechanosensitive channel
MSTVVTNYSRMADERGAMIGTKVSIGYDQSWRQVHAMLLMAWERTSTTLKEPKPFVLQQALSDFYVEYEIRGFIARAETRFVVLSELHANIQDAFNEFGVQIMSPAFESQPQEAVVVPKEKWYAAPGSPDTRGAPPLPPELQGKPAFYPK